MPKKAETHTNLLPAEQQLPPVVRRSQDLYADPPLPVREEAHGGGALLLLCGSSS